MVTTTNVDILKSLKSRMLELVLKTFLQWVESDPHRMMLNLSGKPSMVESPSCETGPKTNEDSHLSQ